LAQSSLDVANSADKTRDVDFLDLDLVRREAQEREIVVADDVLASAVAALAVRKHVLLNAGTARARTEVARTLARASVSAKQSIGYLETHMAAAVQDETDAASALSADWGGATLDDAAQATCWLVLFDVDLWGFSESGMARALARHRPGDIGSWRVIATSAGLARRPLEAGWRQIASKFAWIDLTTDAA
jgi:hypothetical protein